MSNFYTISGTILRNTPVDDATGGQTDAWGTITAGTAARAHYRRAVPFRFSLAGAMDRTLGDEILIFAPGTDIRDGDRWVDASGTAEVLKARAYQFTTQADIVRG